MNKKSTLKIFAAVLSIASSHAWATAPVPWHNETSIGFNSMTPLPPSVYDLDPLIVISQNANEKGLVVIKGNFQKPNTAGDVKVTIKYKDAQNNWVSLWCKTFAGNYEYNEDLTANFELPESALNTHSVKIELSSNETITNWNSIIWDKTVNHYKKANYTYANCDLDENQYTILFTPKKDGTVLYNPNGTVSGVKDRVKSQHLTKKLDDIVLSFQGNAALDNSNANSPVVNITNPNNLTTIASSQKYIYQGSDTSPFEFSYHDPVYMFAGKFSNESFFINFSNWFLPPEEGGEPWGRGYLDFTNPNSLLNRYYNLYNYINEKLGDVFTNQQPVVIVISEITGLRVYKANGQYVSLTALSNYNTTDDFGYPPLYEKQRGPGSENFSLSNTSQASLYGVGAIRNRKVINSWNGPSRPLIDIESEINKFIKYVGIFGNPAAEDCPVTCFAINSGAQSDFVDWTKAPNSYVFTGKDKNGNAVDGLYIPVKKAYEMWAKGGEFMKNDQGSYTPIPAGTASTGLYWEDEPGLIKSVALEGTGEDAKIKVSVNRLKEGNAVVSYRVNNQVYWTWHVWVTDDPTDGSTYRLGFEKDKNGNPVSDWKWMDRNLGATSANFVGNNWNKSQGLNYQWGRKDPFPSLVYKDGTRYDISGEVGNIRSQGSKSMIGATSVLPVKFRGNLYDPQENTGYDTPNGNIRYSIQNPINMIIPPMYVRKKGETVDNNGEDMLVQNADNSWYPQRRTTWFSKQKYRSEFNADPYQNVAWDLWGDTRGGKISDLNNSYDPQMAKESMSYAMKSPYDPCPCNWRVPSYYDNLASPSNDNNASPWGKIGGANDYDAFTSDPATSSTKFPGIKIYPGLGYDFSGVTNRNLGLIPINGNYEYYPNVVTANSIAASGKVKPSIIYQDGSSDGSLGSSTFSVGAANGGPWYGPRGLRYNSDPGNIKEPANNFGLYSLASTDHDGNTHETSGIRCIKDPNNAFMPQIFETNFFTLPAQEYSLETLKSWTNQPNSYVEYTNNPVDVNASDKDRVIDIPLGKAYAMHKLNLSTTEEFPEGNNKSASVVWTTNKDLIENIEIINPDSKELARLRVTLKSLNYGNAVVAFHLGNSTTTWANGKNQDPVIWSWHIWVPETVIASTGYTTETPENGGVLNVNSAFVKPVKSIGAQLETTFMDRDLGALMMFPGVIFSTTNYSLSPALSKSGGLHYQWGKKDPIPAFINPGGNYEFTNGSTAYKNLNRTPVYSQNGPISSGIIPYSTAIDNLNYTANYAKEYAEYSSGILPADPKKDKIKKVLQYSVKNPMYFLYRNTSSETDPNKKIGDWLSDENGQFASRWGHAAEKSPYDPCPEGWRIPDTFSAAVYETEPASLAGFYAGWPFAHGNNPWYYNGYRNTGNGQYGLNPGGIYGVSTTYSATSLSYPGQISMIANYPATRYGFVFNDSHFAIGSFANSGIRGFNGGKDLLVYTKDDAKTIDNGGQVKLKFSGIWTSSPADRHAGQAIGLYIDFGLNAPGSYAISTGNPYYPQTAMSCRCAKIKYDGNGNEIGRYEPLALAVPKNTAGKAVNTFAKKQIEEMQKDSSKLTVFPNPVKSILYINANDKDYYYQIYNVSGQLVKQGKFENKQTDLSSLPQGAYLIRINDSETIVKIIKQ
ncbi:T9SS type A sorting domain-containing protein [Chryseobacterium shigense]|uniref:Secretion system C-terminal sorting domain-containing protein n=1 Tax=Chryseobacterium shigense TaxID=297244 RepID=A0A841N3B0_9FLAO|nr:T9SS type A sorting domain-containing protein [Chryseobacterium shigense]MBB6371636.1 hypothetical protein [Chryseobacterium shigense]